jgi:hypothetical protein
MMMADGWFWAHDIRPEHVGSVVMPGWRLVRLANYGRRFAALIDRQDGPARGHWLDVDAPTLANRLRDNEVRPVAITAGERFTVVYERGPAARVHVDLDETGLRELADRHGVVDVATYVTGGARRFAAIVADGGPSWLLVGVEVDELTAELRNRGATPVRLRAYRESGRRLLLAVAEPAGDTRWFAGLSADGVASALERHDGHPVDLDATRDGDEVRFTVIMTTPHRGR